jgi:hypothetical protein
MEAIGEALSHSPPRMLKASSITAATVQRIDQLYLRLASLSVIDPHGPCH